MINDVLSDRCQTGDTVVTAGSTYLDIDAYACAVAMAELLNLQGKKAIAFSRAPCNYSVCRSLMEEMQIARELPSDFLDEPVEYIIVDVSDPEFLKDSVPLDKVVKVYDHHVGFEDYWTSRIGKGAHIEFIGAAATLVYREWENAGVQDQMTRPTALLLIAAILDNTLNLTSSNTTKEDESAFRALCTYANVGEDFRTSYFLEVQESVEANLERSLFSDIKNIRDNPVLPSWMGQVAVWNVESILARMDDICMWFNGRYNSWMLNIIDIQHHCNYFVCHDTECQKRIEAVFGVRFEMGVAKTSVSYLRKEIIKKTKFLV